MTGRYPGIARATKRPAPTEEARSDPEGCFGLRRPGGPRVRRFDPCEITVVTPVDLWRALPENVADGYASKVVAAVELLFPRARVEHRSMAAARVRVDFPGGHPRSWRREMEDTDREEVERVLDEVVRDVWERETG